MNDPVPFLDLVAPHLELRPHLMSVLDEALAKAAFVGGAAVEKFESSFAEFCDAKFCVGVGSGTDALRFALAAGGVGPGDVVITVPNTFIATTEAISQTGASPVFVDVDEDTYNMDLGKLRQYLDESCELDPATAGLKTKVGGARVAAIVPVHLYGQMADMDPILELADQYNLLVIEDACQAHGAQYFSRKEGRWRKAGSMGHAAAFSFYPGKNLGACGEGGAVTTNLEKIAQRVKMLRDHGQSQKYVHAIEGYNGRLDAIQAGFLSAKLPTLEGGNRRRAEIAKRYHALLAGVPGVKTPAEREGAQSVYHLYVIRVPDRKALQEHLGKAGIGTGIHYPIPLHLQSAYPGLGYKRGDFPVSEAAAEQILSLPMFPTLRDDQILRVVEAVGAFAQSHFSKATVV